MKTYLTGVKPTREPHLGNYVGAIRPALSKVRDDVRSFFFIADYHALISMHDKEELQKSTYEVTATWLACGLDPDKTVIYRQSDIPEIPEICWILSCFTAKGLMNRAHAYKAKLQQNEEDGKKDPDFGVSMGLYNYPVLMAADILAFDADVVPVGLDQVQHLEIARDIAEKVNRTYGLVLRMPEPLVESKILIPGLDGRKMSKSYGNYVPLFAPEKKLRKYIMKIKTDSSPPEAPKDPDNSLIMDFYKLFASKEQVAAFAEQYRKGIAWGDAKQELFERINQEIAPARAQYDELMADPRAMDQTLQVGAERAREASRAVLDRLKAAIGVSHP